MDDFRIPLGAWIESGLDWFKATFQGALDVTSTAINTLVDGLGDALLAVPFWGMILIFALIAWFFRSWQLAIGTILTMIVIVGVNQWDNAMLTLALVLVAALIAVVISVPLGVLAAKSRGFSAFMKPVLDFMQTMPAFVYLIPAVLFFTVGFVPGVFATVLFALPPGVRFTELGIRGVDSETVEAGQAFGAKPGKILRGIQLPLATPTIMAGVNQVIMLALSMAVVAGMAGADGLGKEVVAGIMQMQIGRGIESGLSVVILAVFLDRVTAALGNPGDYKRSLVAMFRSRKAERQSQAVELEVAKGRPATPAGV